MTYEKVLKFLPITKRVSFENLAKSLAKKIQINDGPASIYQHLEAGGYYYHPNILGNSRKLE
jgi:hypothetical protein